MRHVSDFGLKISVIEFDILVTTDLFYLVDMHLLRGLTNFIFIPNEQIADRIRLTKEQNWRRIKEIHL